MRLAWYRGSLYRSQSSWGACLHGHTSICSAETFGRLQRRVPRLLHEGDVGDLADLSLPTEAIASSPGGATGRGTLFGGSGTVNSAIAGLSAPLPHARGTFAAMVRSAALVGSHLAMGM